MFDGAFDDGDVVCVWDQGDDEVVFRDGFVEGGGIGDVEGFGSGIFGVPNEFLCFGKCAAGYNVRTQVLYGDAENFKGKANAGETTDGDVVFGVSSEIIEGGLCYKP